ncbi:MAG TPA: TIGR01212 family radical SAM protein [Candidatus Cloacimonadota bacterium]|nr:TIGR01212 family radical SAM protein [Candidatus Cloacimonadota bacterium]HOQ79791.1 TIGR01212 family radical SAM protein [Candidatus Cloacimonadota bacterium]HPK40104.1 TIGR01212 family radical SAM protein [Candidatus Cloacimonadota bacterium]
MSGLDERINTFSKHYKNKYGRKMFKIGLSTGLECPQRVNNSPCIFCEPKSFIDNESKELGSITQQIDYLTNKISKQYRDIGFIAYFQDNTSTYGDFAFLKKLFTEAINHPLINEVIISTRPDYINEDLLSFFSRMEKDVTFELGIQTIHDKSLQFLNRNHSHQHSIDAINLLKKYSFRVGAHILLGIPNETKADILSTIDFINRAGVDDIKIHHLIAYKNTQYGAIYDSVIHSIAYSSLDEYCDLLIEIIRVLNPNTIISRLFTSNLNRQGNAKNQFAGVKRQWINHLTKMLNEKNIVQGVNYIDYRSVCE